MTEEHRRLIQLAVDDYWAREGRMRTIHTVVSLVDDHQVRQLFQRHRDQPLIFLEQLQKMKGCSMDVTEIVYVVMSTLLIDSPEGFSGGS